MRRAYLLVVLGSWLAACSSSKTSGTGSTTGSGAATSASGSGASASTGTGAGTSTGSGTTGTGGVKDAGPSDASYDVQPVPPPDGSILHPCDLPGSVQFTASGTVVKGGGGASWPSLSFLHLPVGFCAHYYGTVGNARQMRFAPGGELFVASPTTLTTGGGGNGLAAILVLPDDDQDGVADGNLNFLSTLPSTQGLLFAGGYFYYQDDTKIMRLPYATGDRKPAGASAQIADLTTPYQYVSPLHWPKTMDMADDGTLYVGNGGDQGQSCVQPHLFTGGILSVDPAGATPNGVQLVKGFRNPINVRCAKGHDHCFALELALDYSYGQGGREKLVPIHAGDDWGFPCCATYDVPYAGTPAGTDCSGVAADTNSFYIGDTPFGMDFEQGYWPAPYTGSAFVVTHGAAGSWTGARMVAIPMDGTTGLPMPSTNIYDGGNVGMVDFATGWDNGTPTQAGTRAYGRPAAVTFAPDGRLFVANDGNGVIFWIAPLDP